MKYKLTEETKEIYGRTLHRIVCVTASASVSVGDVGGWVESEKNLSQNDDAWVYDDAKVFGNAEVCGNARVYDDAKVKQTSDYIVLKNCWGSGRYFTYTSSNDKWRVGCFRGTGEELIKKAYSEGELKGKCYEASVKYVQEIMRLIKEADK